MCSNFEAILPQDAAWVSQHFGCALPATPWQQDIYPTYAAPLVWLEQGSPRCALAQFGLVPPWAADKRKFGLKTYNARSETVADKPSYRNAWKRGQLGLVPMRGYYEPHYGSGKAVRWRLRRPGHEPLAAAAIWERCMGEDGTAWFTFSLLTVNVDGHPLLSQFHRPGEEKRAIVVPAEAAYGAWLKASPSQARSMLYAAPAGFLTGEAAPRGSPDNTK